MKSIGTITIEDGRITATIDRQHASGMPSSTSACYDECTMEALTDAVRILSRWMNIPWEDRERECRRVHTRDQFYAHLADMIEGCIKRKRDR